MSTVPTTSRANLQLALGTVSFAICFAAWGLISAFAPRFRETFHLTATQTALLVAVPVLLGALLRIVTGMLADRYGGRVVFSLLLIIVAAPAYLVPMVSSYKLLLYVAFFLGMAGSSFAVGVGFVSRWFPPEKQGGSLGIYGLGNIGQSAAVFLGPVLAVAVGWQNIFRGMAALLVVWAVAFYLLARNSPKTVRPASIGAMLQLLSRERLSWVLSLFYFLTFGGFVAFSIYLPVLLKDQFGLKPADAGFRTAGFVVLATLARPLGGWLADKIGGARVLHVVFLGVIPFALLMSWPAMLPFTVGALGCAFLLGNGNGAVFKLVPQYFPKEVGTVTGLVGAMGGLGGFFPPLLLGFFRDHLHTSLAGFRVARFGFRHSVAHQRRSFSEQAAGGRADASRTAHADGGSRAGGRYCDIFHGPGRSVPSWLVRAISRTSIRLWSSTRSQRSLRPGVSSTTTACGWINRPRGSIGSGAGSCFARREFFAGL